MLKRLTKALLLLFPALFVLYDGYAYWEGGNEATISRTLLAWGENCSLLILAFVFVLGGLVAHFFLPQHPNPDTDHIPGKLKS